MAVKLPATGLVTVDFNFMGKTLNKQEQANTLRLLLLLEQLVFVLLFQVR